jgi:hypothetical protein
MKKIGFITLIALVLGGLFAVRPAQAGSAWGDYDSASPLLVRYMDDAATGTITIAASSVTITDAGNANTYSLSASTNKLDLLYAAITSATNASGTKNFQAMYWAGIAADTCGSNALITASATAVTKTWSTVLKWDTSNCLHYDVVVSGMGGYLSAVGGMSIDAIYGSPEGTGNVTLDMYAGGVKKYSKVFTSPYYTTPATLDGTGITTNVAINGVYPNESLGNGIYVGASEVGFVRATRATTATTGGIGCNFNWQRR